jgi:hypothetical protein
LKKPLTNGSRYDIINTERGKENPNKPEREIGIMTTTINAKALNEIAKTKVEEREAARIASLENYIANTVLPKCKEKAEDGQFSHREELLGFNGKETTEMMTMLENLGFKVFAIAGGDVVIKW